MCHHPLVLWMAAAILVIVLGAAALAIAARRDAARGQWQRGLVDLVGAGSMALVWVLAARLAERSSGWTDTDRDGMLDGFANGSLRRSMITPKTRTGSQLGANPELRASACRSGADALRRGCRRGASR
jgi:hypothetical protein